MTGCVAWCDVSDKMLEADVVAMGKQQSGFVAAVVVVVVAIVVAVVAAA